MFNISVSKEFAFLYFEAELNYFFWHCNHFNFDDDDDDDDDDDNNNISFGKYEHIKSSIGVSSSFKVSFMISNPKTGNTGLMSSKG